MHLENNKQNNDLISQENKEIKKAKSYNNLFQIQNKDVPFLSRKDTMYLSSINLNDFPLKKLKQITTKRDWSSNLYNLDIEGSSPKKFGLFTKKIDFTNNNRDIEKSYPIERFKKISPNYSLSNKDIEGSHPKLFKLNIKRCTNPLNPNYNLPKADKKSLDLNKDDNEPNKLKFIRDNINIDDIEGTKPKKLINLFLRNSLNIDDIKGSSPTQRYVRKTKYDNIDYSDIKKIKQGRNRDVNPLSPIYNWNYSINNIKYNVGPIERNQPNPFSVFKYKMPFILNNDDIEGAKAGSKNRYKNFKGSNSCLNIGDIKGAIHDTLIRGIITKRCLNPLNPNYRYLGEEELKTQDNNIFGKIRNSIDNKISKVSSFNLVKTPKASTKIELMKNNIQEKNSLSNSESNIARNKSNTDKKINQILSELNERPIETDRIIFDKNLYKKPEKYFPRKHDEILNFINIDKKHKNENHRNIYLRNLQRLIEKNTNKINNKSDFVYKKKTYENQMDDLIENHYINLKNAEERLNKKINTYNALELQDGFRPKKLFNIVKVE